MVAITILYLWTLAFSFDLLKSFLFATFSLINQLPLNLYNFWSNDAYEWVSGILTCGLDAMLQLSKIKGVADGHSSSSYAVRWWFISFCGCLWLKIYCCYCYCGAPGFDAATAAVELLDHHLAMFGVSLRISWSCCWLVLWGCCNEWTEEVGVYVDAGMIVMVEVILLENTIFTWIEAMKWKTIELMERCMVRSGGDEIYVRQGSLWIFSLLLACLSHPLANNIYVFSFIIIYIFFEKHLGYLREVFNLDICPGRLKEGFDPGIFFFLHFSHPWAASWGFQPKEGTQAPHGGFHLNPYSFFSFLVPWWGRS